MKLNEVIQELTVIKIDMAVITETKGKGSENLGKFYHFCSRVSKENSVEEDLLDDSQKSKKI